MIFDIWSEVAAPVDAPFCRMAERDNHHPQLTLLSDDRYRVRCQECWASKDSPPPIGIGVKITSRPRADARVRNHASRAA